MKKAYVVFIGRKPGVYTSWEECKKQVDGFKNQKFKGYSSLTEAHFNFNNYLEVGLFHLEKGYPEINKVEKKPVGTFLTVDASFRGKSKILEWRGVLSINGKNEEVFRSKEYELGSANLGEFIAIIDGLIYLTENNLDIEIYSDSWNAQKWVLAKSHASKAKLSEELTKELNRKSILLSKGTFDDHIDNKRIIDWNSKDWGEIPADFGRK